MTQLVIVAHAPLASAFAGVGGHCFNEAAGALHVIDVPPSDDADAVAVRLRERLAALADAHVLVLVDAIGATPYNGAVKYAQGDPRVRVLAGLNMPMLWRTMCYLSKPFDELVALALQGGIEGIERSRS